MDCRGGYCGGSGADVALSGNGQWWGVTGPEDDAEAYNVDFDNAYLGARSISGRAWGMAVRLVCPPLPAEPEKPAPAEKKKPVLPPKGKMLKR